MKPYFMSRPKEGHSRGQRYHTKNHEGKKQIYILAMCGMKTWVLINIKTGEYWSFPVEFRRTEYLVGISDNQFTRLIGKENKGKFKKIK